MYFIVSVNILYIAKFV